MTMVQAVDPMVPTFFRIERVRRETPDLVTLEMNPAADSASLPFAPGQFNMLYAVGVGEVPVSISGDPAQSGKLVHTIRAVGAITRSRCRLKRGDQVGVRGPFGAAGR
jgi:NAD(P)H-flavin reductase